MRWVLNAVCLMLMVGLDGHRTGTHAQETTAQNVIPRFSPEDEQALAKVLVQIDQPIKLETLSAEQLRAAIAEKCRQRVLTLRKQLEIVELMYSAGGASTEQLTVAITALAEAEQEVATTRAARVQALQHALDAVRQLESVLYQKRQLGARGAEIFHASSAQRLTWEIRLAQELLKPGP